MMGGRDSKNIVKADIHKTARQSRNMTARLARDGSWQ